MAPTRWRTTIGKSSGTCWPRIASGLGGPRLADRIKQLANLHAFAERRIPAVASGERIDRGGDT